MFPKQVFAAHKIDSMKRKTINSIALQLQSYLHCRSQEFKKSRILISLDVNKNRHFIGVLSKL
jgi:hypothetical protein